MFYFPAYFNFTFTLFLLYIMFTQVKYTYIYIGFVE